MGAGIAFTAAAAGLRVDLIEPDCAAADRARQRIGKDAERAKQPDVPGRVDYYQTLQPGTVADAAIEAVPERLDLKRAVFEQLARTLDAGTLLATNTSSLSVSEIAQGVSNPERVVGLHFFNPPAAMKLVEVVRGDETSEETISRASALVERLKKTAVLTADTPGFVVNRVARPYYLQAMRAYEAGVAPVEELDRIARGIGFRMGPFELIDLIGMDVNLATSESVYERTEEDRFEPAAVQRELVAQNRLGRKTGSGFYDYAQGPPSHYDAAPQPAENVEEDERIVVLGFGGVALEMHERLQERYSRVDLREDEDALEDLPADATVVFDVGDGASDRSAAIELLDRKLAPETVIFVDAYATDVDALAKRLEHPERIVGYGILASLEEQLVVEIVDAEHTSDDALELAQELSKASGAASRWSKIMPGCFWAVPSARS